MVEENKAGVLLLLLVSLRSCVALSRRDGWVGRRRGVGGERGWFSCSRLAVGLPALPVYCLHGGGIETGAPTDGKNRPCQGLSGEEEGARRGRRDPPCLQKRRNWEGLSSPRWPNGLGRLDFVRECGRFFTE